MSPVRPGTIYRYLVRTYSTAQWHRHRAPSSSCSLKLRPRHNEHSLISFFSSSRHLSTNSLFTTKLFPLLCLFSSSFSFTSRSEPCELKQEAAGINRVLDLEVRRGCVLLPTTLKLQFRPPTNQTFTKDAIPEILQPSSDCSRLETCSQTWSWHLARGILSLGQGHGSCRLIRP